MNKNLYFDLLKRTILGMVGRDNSIVPVSSGSIETAYNGELRYEGRDWPTRAHSMIGMHRMNNLLTCIENVLDVDGPVPGNFLEAGVWRGGASIFMRAVLKAYGVTDRIVYVADSFAGLPIPDVDKYPEDKGLNYHLNPELVVPLHVVKENFVAYGMLDSQVHFIQGWFKDTLPKADVGKLAILRLDGDMYESTIDTLNALYDRVSPGGYVIVDDLAIDACAQAVADFRNTHRITEMLYRVDWTGGYWRKR